MWDPNKCLNKMKIKSYCKEILVLVPYLQSSCKYKISKIWIKYKLNLMAEKDNLKNKRSIIKGDKKILTSSL